MKIKCSKHCNKRPVKSSTRCHKIAANVNIASLVNIANSALHQNAGSIGNVNVSKSGKDSFQIHQYDVGTYTVEIENGVANIYTDDGELSTVCRSGQDMKKFIDRLNNAYYQMRDESEERYSANASTKIRRKPIRASEDFFCDDPKYLMALADEIESCLYTDFNIDAQCWSDGACIHITCDIDDEEVEEGLITENDLVSLTGDLETDAYVLAEEFYAST